jgi:hypothetical protein
MIWVEWRDHDIDDDRYPNKRSYKKPLIAAIVIIGAIMTFSIIYAIGTNNQNDRCTNLTEEHNRKVQELGQRFNDYNNRVNTIGGALDLDGSLNHLNQEQARLNQEAEQINQECKS